MRVALLMPLLLVAACGDSKKEPPFRRYLASRLPGGLSGAAHLELAGVRGAVAERIGSSVGSTMVDVPSTTTIPPDARMTLHYDTPCGARSLSFPMPTGTPNEHNVVKFDIPETLVAPQWTYLILDPTTAEPVTLGSARLDPKQPIAVLDATCGVPIKIGATEVVIPPPPVQRAEDLRVQDHSHALLVTPHDKQCFVDLRIAYGDANENTRRELTGASVYWLDYRRYDYLFESPPSSLQSRDKGATRTAVDRCAGK